ncbi:MAG: hypothetical protein GWN71_35395, partial [Gammaproteobacteria bacterium]|nr:hypothetical protein [Gammaproteobacteria bacterium]NIY11872.1 hypothetical protein [Gemmatimonadota bacterium]
VLGIFALTLQGLQGAMIVMLSHGVSTGAMFLLLGMLYERRHTRTIADFGGLAAAMPAFGTVFMITALASIGLPGTSGFVGEFLALLGTFQTHPIVALIATTGVIFAAYYMLPMVQRIWFNALDRPENENLPDLSRRELAVLLPMVAVMLWMGVYPKPFLDRTESSVEVILENVERNRGPAFGQAEVRGVEESLEAGVPVGDGLELRGQRTGPTGDEDAREMTVAATRAETRHAD